MRRQLSILLVVAAVAALAAAPAGSAEGRIPVWMPMVITQPGHYVLTRDISTAAGSAVSIIDDGVTLDLNGHTVSSTDTSQPVIQIGGSPGAEKGIIIVNGGIHGGMHGILHSPPAGDRTPLSLARLIISGATESAVKGMGFSKLEAQGIIIVNSKLGFDLRASAPGVPPPPVPPQATVRGVGLRGGGGIHCTGVVCSIQDMTFEYEPPSAAPTTPAIRFSGATGGEAVGIIIINSMPAASGTPLVDVVASRGIIVIDGRIQGPGMADGSPCIAIDAMSRDFIIDDGKLSGCGGDAIRALGAIGRITDVFISGAAGHGIFAGGTHFIIDDGDIVGNAGAGIWFETPDHVYRNNVLGDNGPNVAGPGAADVRDAGGNVLL